jgi:hypothetical protein
LLRGDALTTICFPCLIFLPLWPMVRCGRYAGPHWFGENMARQIFSFSFRASH